MPTNTYIKKGSVLKSKDNSLVMTHNCKRDAKSDAMIDLLNGAGLHMECKQLKSTIIVKYCDKDGKEREKPHEYNSGCELRYTDPQAEEGNPEPEEGKETEETEDTVQPTPGSNPGSTIPEITPTPRPTPTSNVNPSNSEPIPPEPVPSEPIFERIFVQM